MNRPVLVATVAVLAMTPGCSSWRMVPDNAVPISNSFQPPLDAVVGAVLVGAAAYYIIDPAAPNWEVRTVRLDAQRVEISLRKKRFSVGGDGEAQSLFQRQARDLASQQGASGYQILSYSEEIESETTYARRVSRGVVRLLKPA